jgi:hypothetical protein
MPNQPAPNTKGHYIAAIPDNLWDEARAVAAILGESVSAAARRGLVEYVEENRWRLDLKPGGMK